MGNQPLEMEFVKGRGIVPRTDNMSREQRQELLDELLQGQPVPRPLELNDYDEARDRELTEVSDEILINELPHF